MTGFMHEREFSRKSFLKGTGALVVSFSAIAGKASAATGNTPFSKRTPADYLPDLNSIDSWLAITADNKVIVSHGEPEFAGTPTGILMLAAEELDITDMGMMEYAHPESWLNATGGGGGSGGISSRSTQLRAAAAYAKQIMMGMASTQLGVPVASLSASNGVISGGGKTVKFSDLFGGKNFAYTMSTANGGQTSATPGQGIAKPVANYKLVGQLKHRIDIPAKVMGTYTYIHNVRIPGMVHGRSVRPRGAGANSAQNHYPLSVDATSIAHIPGAQVVQINNFIGVVAPKEYDAIQAAAQLKVVWKSDPKFGSGSAGNYWSWMRKAADVNTDNPPRFSADTGGVPAALAGAAKTVSATYKYQYNNFVPIGPHAAIADVRGTTSAVVYVQGQAINSQSNAVSAITGVPANQVRVIWYEGSSSYGGGQQLQAVEQAASMSQKIGKPVRIQWMRWDQHGWDSYGPSHMYDVKGAIDGNGKIVAMDWVAYGQPNATIDTHLELLGTATWPATPANGGPTPSDSAVYTVPQRRILAKTQPGYGGSLKISALRAPNAPQSYFASEQIVDELAYAAKMDPIAFRRANIDGSTVLGSRWLSVMDASTIAAGWKAGVANSRQQTGDVRTGRGYGFGTFASSQVGVVADVEVNVKTGKIVAKHVWVAQNNGVTVNLEGVTTQMSGALIQGLSRAMYEQATWNKERVTSLDWVSYPILRFKDSPTVTMINVHPGKYTVVKPGDESQNVQSGNTAAFNSGWNLSGSGEPPTTAISSAVANAFFDATGVRIRQSPMNPATARQVLKDAGIS